MWGSKRAQPRPLRSKIITIHPKAGSTRGFQRMDLNRLMRQSAWKRTCLIKLCLVFHFMEFFPIRLLVGIGQTRLLTSREYWTQRLLLLPMLMTAIIRLLQICTWATRSILQEESWPWILIGLMVRITLLLPPKARTIFPVGQRLRILLFFRLL